jgi:hypothetical protein
MPKGKMKPNNGAGSMKVKTGQGSYQGPMTGSGMRGTSKGKLNPTNGAKSMPVSSGQGSYRGPANGVRDG